MQTTLGENFSFSHATIRLVHTGPTLRLPRKEKKWLKGIVFDNYRYIASVHGLPIPKKAPKFRFKPEEQWPM